MQTMKEDSRAKVRVETWNLTLTFEIDPEIRGSQKGAIMIMREVGSSYVKKEC